MLASAGEARDAYFQHKGRQGTQAEADVIYAQRLGLDGIKLALQTKQLAPDEALYYQKLLTGKK